MGDAMGWRPRRIAWLLTHSSLRSAEVPILRSLGCEVWTQKAFPDDPAYRSCSADPRWDEGSSLPPDALAALNAFDFYSEAIPPRLADILNEHFDLAVIDPFPIKTREVLSKFKGPVLARAFGREEPHSYSQMYFEEWIPGLAAALREHYRRFWFSAFYPEVIPYEVGLLRGRAFHLPITLPEAAWRREGTWEGGDPRVLFVCPSINDHDAGRWVYDGFKRHLGALPHVIAGRQDNPVRDPNVLGFLPAAEYDTLYRRVAVMYYHGREPRHLHYHPMEAMASGMPVVYLRGGLLEQYDTGTQAGACADEAEARDKLRRVLGGDAALIAGIRESQRTVVEKWRPGIAREAWRRWLDLFAPDADGRRPVDGLWDAAPPAPQRDELWRFPYLDPATRPMFPLLWRMCMFAGRYVEAAMRQRTLLPRGIRTVERVRRALGWAGRHRAA